MYYSYILWVIVLPNLSPLKKNWNKTYIRFHSPGTSSILWDISEFLILILRTCLQILPVLWDIVGLSLQTWIHLKWLHAVFLLSYILDGALSPSFWLLFYPCQRENYIRAKKELIGTSILPLSFVITWHTLVTSPVTFLFIFLFQTTYIIFINILSFFLQTSAF